MGRDRHMGPTHSSTSPNAATRDGHCSVVNDCAKYTENVYYTGLGSHTLNLAF